MNPELYEYIEEQLFSNGALDVYKTPIIMKKGRPAIKLTILTKEADVEVIKELIFKETTSLGIRGYRVDKIMLERDFQRIKTKYGDVTVKNAYYNGQRIKYKAEYSDCKGLATKNKVSINDIYKEVHRLIEEMTDDEKY